MKLTIDAEPKEIAAFIEHLQTRQEIQQKTLSSIKVRKPYERNYSSVELHEGRDESLDER